MKNLFGDKSDPAVVAREAVRRKKWGKALEYFEKKLQENERDFALWNFVGDLHMNNRGRAQAVEAWRRALEGYAMEGLHENVLGIARKILRRAPEEEEIQLVLAEAYLGLEYYADCLAAFRAYLKLAKQRSESDMRSLTKKILDAKIEHAHLLEELSAIYHESGIDDYELQQRVAAYVEDNRKASGPASTATARPSDDEDADVYAPASGERGPDLDFGHGLTALDGLDNFGAEDFNDVKSYRPAARAGDSLEDFSSSFETPTGGAESESGGGEGKDHFDLGVVYREMRLWDAAAAEFEQARKDRTFRVRATLALAECLSETHDMQSALELLEAEQRNSENSSQDELTILNQAGALHETLGNLEQALVCFERVRSHGGDPALETRIAELRDRLGGDTASEN